MSMEKGRRIVLEEADAAAPARTPPAERTVLEPAPSEDEAADAGDPLEPAAQRVSGVSRWLPAGLGLGAVLLLLHTFYALATLLRESPLLGIAWSAVFVLVAGGAGRALWRLWRALRGARQHEAHGPTVSEPGASSRAGDPHSAHALPTRDLRARRRAARVGDAAGVISPAATSP